MPSGKAKLLIVDDEPVIVEIITKWLCHGYDIRNAYEEMRRPLALFREYVEETGAAKATP